MQKIKISIIGATSFTALELIRLLQPHDYAEITSLISNSTAGQKISYLYPHLQNICDLTLQKADYEKISKENDIVFLCLPHLLSQKVVSQLIGKIKIIDMSGDFRINNSKQFSHYYNAEHLCHDLTKHFTYGLPELNREIIKKSENIANVGCFASNAELALLPITEKIQNVDIVSLTGSSGSGKNHSIGTHHPMRSKNVKSYKINTHQHIPEIAQTLGIPIEKISFVPTSAPFVRGIASTSFITLQENISEDIEQIYAHYYSSHPFIRIKKSVQLVNVVGSHYTDISITKISSQKYIVQCVTDNLIKGASGTGIQNMNLMFGFDEKTGLEHITPLYI